MKKIWKMKKSKEAVSPVIATILMVAITVVLAAVLYVMVMGFGSSPESSPTASLQASQTGTAHTEKITVAAIDPSQNYSNIKVSIVFGGATYVATVGTALSGPTGWTVTYVDIAGSTDGKVSAGDYILVTNANGATGQVVINLLYGGDSKSIASTNWNAF